MRSHVIHGVNKKMLPCEPRTNAAIIKSKEAHSLARFTEDRAEGHMHTSKCAFHYPKT